VANSAQAKKRARQADNNNLRLKTQRTAMRTSIKKFLKALAEKQIDIAKNLLQEVASRVDTLARKNVIHRNKASRIKSRLSKRLKESN
jgi:small subunit ribosomal protein S20